MNCQPSCKGGDARTVPESSIESSAEFARCRKWARDMAHKYTVRHDGYERWDFKDGSSLVHLPNGLLTAI